MVPNQLPFYISFTFKLAMILLLIVFINLGQAILVPLIFAIRIRSNASLRFYDLHESIAKIQLQKDTS